MNLDLATLRLVKTRQNYERYAKAIPPNVLSVETGGILKQMGAYFKDTQAESILVDEFFTYVRSKFPKWNEKVAAQQLDLIRPLDSNNPEGYNEKVLQNLLAADLANKSLALVEQWKDGAEIDLGESYRVALDAYEQALLRKVKTPRVRLDFAAMLAQEQNDTGMHWRTQCIDRYLKPLRPGDFGVLAARPDRGKTTAVACEITHMAPQLLTLYPDTLRPVLWLNNEGPGDRINQRIVMSALDMDVPMMLATGEAELQRLYLEAMGNHPDLIQVYDIHGFQTYEVEELFRKLNPGLVIYDMIDNISFGGVTLHGGERTDQVLEAMYQWARMMAVKYEFAALATSQISDPGEGLRYPSQNMLKDSRTGKQGACDFIITVGQDPQYPSMRYIGTTKQKTKRHGTKPSLEAEVWFDGDKGRLREVPVVDTAPGE